MKPLSMAMAYEQERVPETLCYYCSVEAFIGIIQSKTLWMSNGFSMNDFLEVKWADHIIREVLDNHRKDTNKAFLDKVWQHYEINKFQPYFACFSSKADMLSQWRAYADDGYGFAIGFRSAALDIKKHLPLPNQDPKVALGIHKVIYSTEQQHELVEKHVREALENVDWNDEHSQEGPLVALFSMLRRLSFVLSAV